MATQDKTIKNYRGWKIRPQDSGSWQIDNTTFSNRIRIKCPSLEAAKLEIDRQITKQENYGRQGDSLPDHIKAEVARLLAEEGGIEKLKEKLKFHKQHHPDAGTAATLRQMVDKWIEVMVLNKRRPATIKAATHKSNALCEKFGDDKPVCEITRQQLLDFIANRPGCEQTKISWRVVLHTFFQFCLGDDEAIPPIPQVIEVNPLARKRQKRRNKNGGDLKSPSVWSPDQVRRLLWKCEEVRPESCAAFAVAFFAGLRPTELGGQYGVESESVREALDNLAPYTAAIKKIMDEKRKAIGTPAWSELERSRLEAENARLPFVEALHRARLEDARKKQGKAHVMDRLRWEDIDLQARTIHVRKGTSKMHYERFVDISDNLLAWLLKYRKPTGFVAPAPPTFRRHRKEVMNAIGETDWPPDVARHSFASYYLAFTDSIDKTQMQMGHVGDSAVLFNHYRKNVSKEAAAKYWAVFPNSYSHGCCEDHGQSILEYPAGY